MNDSALLAMFAVCTAGDLFYMTLTLVVVP